MEGRVPGSRRRSTSSSDNLHLSFDRGPGGGTNLSRSPAPLQVSPDFSPSSGTHTPASAPSFVSMTMLRRQSTPGGLLFVIVVTQMAFKGEKVPQKEGSRGFISAAREERTPSEMLANVEREQSPAADGFPEVWNASAAHPGGGGSISADGHTFSGTVAGC